MADSSDIENAVIALLGADATLLALCPNGVYNDEAPPTSTRFVIVSLVDESDEPMFNGTAFEDMTLLVKAVMQKLPNGPNPDVKSAAARIQALLHQQPLTVSGYGVSVMRRTSRVRLTEVDDEDQSLRWQHRGGLYNLVAST